MSPVKPAMTAALVLVFAACGTEVVQVYECRCHIVWATPFRAAPDSVSIVVFDTLGTPEACEEAGRSFCPTLEGSR